MARNRGASEAAPHRVQRTLAEAQSNPVLSGAESCAVDQAHALLAVEQRLAQLCTILESTLAQLLAIAGSKDPALVATSPSLVA